MFVSHDKNIGKKTFQKPNILRRKTKTKPKLNLVNKSSSTTEVPIVTTHSAEESTTEHTQNATVEVSDTQIQTLIKPTVWKILNNSHNGGIYIEKTLETEKDDNIISSANEYNNITQNNNKCFDDNSLNIEAFLNNEAAEKTTPTDEDTSELLQQKTSEAKTKWCFDISNNSMDIISIDNVNETGELEQKSEFVVDVEQSDPIMLPTDIEETSQPEMSTLVTTSINNLTVDCFSNRAIKFKCDFPNCNKGFWIEERLNKHKMSHNRQVINKNSTRILIECPVKKIGEDGAEERCPQTFQVRRDLLKHLNADHTPEDALYRCEVCGRRFFWASGLRAHAQSVCARGGLACDWPGCERTFHLPCRLREHTRAHTGDRPYMCQYPECGWAFRSASKLVRHARRHTDERRHACTACGRAFLRREHLRDHAARHHAPRARPTHHCTHPGCEQTFTNMSSLYMHMKKVHRKDKKEGGASSADKSKTIKRAASDSAHDYEKYVVQINSTGSDSSEEAGGAARTHVTWPLPRHARNIDDIVTVEQAEDSASNVYTVRSDLFLHSNVPLDEDSQHIGSVQLSAVGVSGVGGASGAALDAELGLHDHPTIDLMQEELIYEDAAVDETSFRLLLMNGEELT